MVADMLVRDDDPAVMESLLYSAYEKGRQAGSDVFELLGFPANVRQVCSAWHPYQRQYPACPFYYRAADPALQKTLTDSVLWYATPFDGDTTLTRPAYSDTGTASVFRGGPLC